MDGYNFPQINQDDLTSIHAVEAMKNLLVNTQEPFNLDCHRSTYKYCYSIN